MSLNIGIGIRIGGRKAGGETPYVIVNEELTTYTTGLVTPLSDTQLERLDTFISTLKSALSISVLSEVFDTLYVRAGETIESSLKNLARDLNHSVLAGTPNPVHIPGAGFVSDGANGYIDTNFNASTQGVRYTQNNASVGIYSMTERNENVNDLGVSNGTYLTNLVIRNGTSLVYRVNADLSTVGTVNTDSRGMFIISRTASNLTTPYLRGVAGTTTTEVGRALNNLNFYELSLNNSGNPATFSTKVISFTYHGRGVTQEEVTAIGSAFDTYLNSFRTSAPVWQSMGSVLTPPVMNEKIILEPCVLYEANAQILETSGSVFKMWHTYGLPHEIHYAESLDGLTWTKYGSNPLLSGFARSSIIKNDGTYYLYVTYGDEAIDLYTSADGITFALDTAGVLTKGGVDTWDVTKIANTFVLIEGGMWYMFYDAIGAGATYWRTGLATSPDGVTWTKYGTAPIISETSQVSGPFVKKIGSLFYLWGHGGWTASLPTDIHKRYKSPNLINWVTDTSDLVYERATVNEGVGLAIGQVADPWLIEVNNKVYLFHCASKDGNQVTGEFHIKLAIADMSFTELIKTNEGRIL